MVRKCFWDKELWQEKKEKQVQNVTSLTQVKLHERKEEKNDTLADLHA